MHEISDRQIEVLDMLRGVDGVTPTLADMSAALGIRVQSVHSHVKALHKRGLVERFAGPKYIHWRANRRGLEELAMKGR